MDGDDTVDADALDDEAELLEPHAASTGTRTSAATHATAVERFI
jgi:hypothetical protein